MLAEFIRFYGYTAQEALDEFAIRFFSLCNSMSQLQADENITSIINSAASQSASAEEVIRQYKKQSKGLPGLLDEVRSVPR